jgi:beta-glucanase (GH16 family)
MNFTLALTLLAAALSACSGKLNNGGDTSVKLELVAISEKSLSVNVGIESAETVNFAYVQCTGAEQSFNEMIEGDPLGTHTVTFSGLTRGETYLITAYADVAGRDSAVSSEAVSARTGKAVEVELLGREGTQIQVKLCINIPGEAQMKGITYKKKSSHDDPTYVLMEGEDMTCTINDADKYSTYSVQGFADLGGGYLWSDELTVSAPAPDMSGDYKLVFSAEFNEDGEDLSKVWTYEEGSKIRNNEDQFYSRSAENSFTKDGCLHIVARRNHLGSDGKTHSYTSASLTTRKSFVYCYGRVEVRAKIPTGGGMWPAIWQVGNTWSWPQNGELDIMEYYREKILANVAFGGTQSYSPTWRSSSHPMSKFESKNPNWRQEFHIWLLEWDYDWVRIYLDGDLLNEVPVAETFNKGVGGNYENPYRYSTDGFGHYLWLNLAIGGNNGGTIDNSLFPAEYLIDYVRVYQKDRLPADN